MIDSVKGSLNDRDYELTLLTCKLIINEIDLNLFQFKTHIYSNHPPRPGCGTFLRPERHCEQLCIIIRGAGTWTSGWLDFFLAEWRRNSGRWHIKSCCVDSLNIQHHRINFFCRSPIPSPLNTRANWVGYWRPTLTYLSEDSYLIDWSPLPSTCHAWVTSLKRCPSALI